MTYTIPEWVNLRVLRRYRDLREPREQLSGQEERRVQSALRPPREIAVMAGKRDGAPASARPTTIKGDTP